MVKVRKKQVVVEAIQWNGKNIKELREFVGESLIENNIQLKTDGECICEILCNIAIKTLEGNMFVGINDYIIKGVQGEFYPCIPDIFEETYEVIDNG